MNTLKTIIGRAALAVTLVCGSLGAAFGFAPQVVYADTPASQVAGGGAIFLQL